MTKRKPKQSQPVPEPEFASEQTASEVSTFTEIGGSPVPGLTLRQVLRGHTDWIGRMRGLLMAHISLRLLRITPFGSGTLAAECVYAP
jgi:hypothetical protein